MSGDSCIVAGREILHYKFSIAFIVIRIGVLLLASRRRRQSLAASRPAWDAYWYLPFYVASIESLWHGSLWYFGTFHTDISYAGFCYVAHAALALTLSLCVLAVCTVQEALGVHLGMPGRGAGGTIPLPVVAAAVGVAATWALWCMAAIPVFIPV